MKFIRICFLSFIALVFSSNLLANGFERGTIAEAAENVTPLLNGQSLPNVTLKTAEGDPVSLKALAMQKPSIILFYRGGWCPYCNRQLAALKDIEKDLVDMGYQVLAISPESPARLQEQKLETEFAVQIGRQVRQRVNAIGDQRLGANRGADADLGDTQPEVDDRTNNGDAPQYPVAALALRVVAVGRCGCGHGILAQRSKKL